MDSLSHHRPEWLNKERHITSLRIIPLQAPLMRRAFKDSTIVSIGRLTELFSGLVGKR